MNAFPECPASVPVFAWSSNLWQNRVPHSGTAGIPGIPRRLLFCVSRVKFFCLDSRADFAVRPPCSRTKMRAEERGGTGTIAWNGLPEKSKDQMLSIDLSVIVIFVIVWILVLVLTKVYFKPLRRVMGEREDKVQDDQAAARMALEKYDQALEKIEEDMKKAKIEAREAREKFVEDAQKEKEHMIEEVSRECRAQVADARKELEERVQRLKEELEPKNQDLADRIAKRLLN